MEHSRTALTEAVAKRKGKRAAKEKCPACGAKLENEVRLCPECGNPAEFMWCPDSEEYIDRCPKCGDLLTLGTPRCKGCGTALKKGVTCMKCSKRADISEWKSVRSS